MNDDRRVFPPPPPPVRKVRVCVIGSVLRLVEEGDMLPPLPASLKKGGAARLLALLVLSHQTYWTHRQIAEALWGQSHETAPEEARKSANTRQALSRLHREWEPLVESGFVPLLGKRGQEIFLHREAYSSDIEHAARLHKTAQRCEPGTPKAHQAWHALLSLCEPGTVLDGWDDDFLKTPRSQVNHWMQEALVQLAENAERSGNPKAARRAARHVLGDTIGTGEFSARAHAVMERLQSRKPPLPLMPAPVNQPLASAFASPLHLPFPEYGNSFLGRDEEMRELNARIAEPATRLVTLVGPGGVGKTRLLAQWAKAWQKAQTAPSAAEAARPLFLVNLASLVDADFVPPVTAAALHLPPTKGDPAAHIGDYLRGTFRPILLFDNAEHLLPPPFLQPGEASQSDGLRDFFNQLIRDAPNATLVVTSRQRLQLRAETVLTVSPLPCPPVPPVHPPGISAKEAATRTQSEADALGQWSSVRLFLDRGRQVKSSFAQRKSDVATVAQMVHLLDACP